MSQTLTAADWECRCGVHNDPLRRRCYSCRSSREYAEVKPEPAPWRPMHHAPTTGPIVWVVGQLADGREVRMHFAQDLSGEAQPPFKGWFIRAGSYHVQVEPLRWRPLEANEPTGASGPSGL